MRKLGARLFASPSARRRWNRWGLAVYLTLLVLDVLWPKPVHEAAHLTIKAALIEAPFRWWMLSSLLGFAIFVPLYLIDLTGRWTARLYHKLFAPTGSDAQSVTSLARRRFLARTAVAVSATPFAACAYGLLLERMDIETTYRRIFLRRLPKAFDGFRIAQLSDIHIGPFTTARDVRKCVAMVNQLKPDLVALTGDFVTWQGSPEFEVVEALSGLKAPYGIFGSIGNHEMWAGVQDSITRLFAAQGTRILRQENVAIVSASERLNLLGVDYQSRVSFGRMGGGFVKEYLEGVEPLLVPDTANILMSHNPNTFDRAAELGIDLSLSGHTHGGQVTMEYISPDISPARLITQYVRGWFRKGDSQLYVNRGIGTIFSPVRIDCPPEITVYELKRA